MPDYGDLTDLQLMILTVLWNEPGATIGTIHEQMSRRGPITRKTVATILSRLEQTKRLRLVSTFGAHRAPMPRRPETCQCSPAWKAAPAGRKVFFPPSFRGRSRCGHRPPDENPVPEVSEFVIFAL